ncbi:MAG: 50S ribosomal protein L18 [Candidatus Euphemobacter frigidus]|nr:50S ribosomal protein L18 [Candidatus Euphemobacter frigidus]MDP8276188.1 50S ribosomal protein L18 [Candidatus Euphemobacter frigidus]
MRPGTKQNAARRKRSIRIRKKVRGTAARPRMSVYRSLRNLSVQFIDDETGRTLGALSTLSPVFKKKYQKGGGTVEAAAALGELVGATAAELLIEEVVFDRGCYHYHGRIRALAEASRKNGLIF